MNIVDLFIISQVPEARIALTHNNSGMGEHVVMVYGKDRP